MSPRSSRCFAWLPTVFLLAGLSSTAAAADAEGQAQTPPERVDRFFARHCYACHGAEESKGDLRLDRLSRDASDPEAAQVWSLVWQRLHDGEMPPAERPRPDRAEATEVLRWVAERTRAAARSSGLRRLNRIEFENTLRDLFDLPALDVQNLLPPDVSSQGFDKEADALGISHVQIAGYLAAAEEALDQASEIALAAGPTRDGQNRLSSAIRRLLAQPPARRSSGSAGGRWARPFDLRSRDRRLEDQDARRLSEIAADQGLWHLLPLRCRGQADFRQAPHSPVGPVSGPNLDLQLRLGSRQANAGDRNQAVSTRHLEPPAGLFRCPAQQRRRQRVRNLARTDRRISLQSGQPDARPWFDQRGQRIGRPGRGRGVDRNRRARLSAMAAAGSQPALWRAAARALAARIGHHRATPASSSTNGHGPAAADSYRGFQHAAGGRPAAARPFHAAGVSQAGGRRGGPALCRAGPAMPRPARHAGREPAHGLQGDSLFAAVSVSRARRPAGR